MSVIKAVDGDDLRLLLEAYEELAGEAEQLAAIEGLGECVKCSTPTRCCARCGTPLSHPAILVKPQFLDEIVLKRLQKMVGP